MTENEDKILSLLGLARRSGNLYVGQDKVFNGCSKIKAVALTAADCSDNVLRSLRNAVVLPLTVSRAELGQAVGVSSAQIVALDADSGFAKKIFSIVNRSDANE